MLKSNIIETEHRLLKTRQVKRLKDRLKEKHQAIVTNLQHVYATLLDAAK